MSLPVFISIASIGAMVFSFLQIFLNPDANKGKWRTIVGLSLVALLLSITTEIGKYISEQRRETAAKQKEIEQRDMNRRLLAEVGSLNSAAMEAFGKLEQSINSLPAASALSLAEQARKLKTDLSTLATATAPGSSVDNNRLEHLIEDTRANVQQLTHSIEAQSRQPRPSAQSQPPTDTETGPRPVDVARSDLMDRGIGALPKPLGDPQGQGRYAPATPSVLLSPAAAPVDDPYSQQTSSSPVEPISIEEEGFLLTGRMGDAIGDKFLQIDPNSKDNPHSASSCQKLVYSPHGGADRWAAVAWQFPANNWGEKPGKDWSKRGFKQVSIWARGETSVPNEFPTVQFKAGGHTDESKKYQATFEVETDFQILTHDWKQYSLSLSGKNLKQVIAAFVIVLKASDTKAHRVTVYLDDIEYKWGGSQGTPRSRGLSVSHSNECDLLSHSVFWLHWQYVTMVLGNQRNHG